MKIRKNNGFSLIELLIVIALIGILSTIASYSWQRYINNTNLRTAARDIASDFQHCKAKAVSESRDYEISFTTGASSSYTISAPAVVATYTYAAVSTAKSLNVYGSGIQITSASFSGSSATNIIRFQSRGTSSNGTVIMTNSRASTATISTNITGKAYVQFAMQ